LGVTSSQLRDIATQHQKLEDELLVAEERVLRLRKQKKLWFEKMMRALSRGIDTVEELEKVEKEEAERAEQARLSNRPSSSEGRVDPEFMENWEDVYGHVELDPSLFETFGFAISGGSSAGQASSGSPGVH
jgi:hypothetical protein